MLQKIVMRTAQYAMLGGVDGMRMTRAAFAVMIKFSDLKDDWNSCVDTVQLEIDDPAQCMSSLKDDFPTIIERYKSAARMRQWIN